MSYQDVPGAGAPVWRETSATFASLPATGIEGEVRLVLDTDILYEWNGSSWQAIGAGVVVLGTTTVSGGTTGSVLFVGAASVIQQDNANFFWDDTNNRLGIGTAAPASQIHVATSTTATGAVLFEQASADADGVDLSFRKTRGTVAAPTVITTADELGTIMFRGYSGAGGYVTGAAIKGISEGTIATTRVPAHLSFWTGTDAAPTVLTERMRINSAGNVGIGITPVGRLHLAGANSSTAWSSAGVGLRIDAATYTDTTSSGAVTFTTAHAINAPTIAASAAATYATACTLFVAQPVAGTNATFTSSTALYLNSTATASAQTIVGTTTTSTTIGVKDARIMFLNNSGTVNAGAEVVLGAAKDVDTYRYASVGADLQANNATGAIGDISISTKAAVGDTTLSRRLTVTAAGNVNTTNQVAVNGTVSSLALLITGGGTNPLTGTTQIGNFVQFTATSGATANMRGIQTSLTSPASTTVAVVAGFVCAGVALGGGGTATRVHNLEIYDQTIGTNNASIVNSVSSLAAYTGNWFIYSDSTRSSYIEGRLALGSATTPVAKFTVAGNLSSAAWITAGIGIKTVAATFTDTSSSGTVAATAVHAIATPTIAASSATTYTASTTLYIAASPTAGTNVTQTNAYALWIDSGNARFDGSVGIGGTVAPSVALDVTGNVKISAASSECLKIVGTGTTGASSAGFIGFYDSNGTTLYGYLGDASGGDIDLYLDTANSANLKINNTSQVLINRTSGLVGINVSTAAARLHLGTASISAAAWTTNGIGIRSDAATYTDTSSSGTVTTVAVHALATPTIAASSSTTYTNAATLYLAGRPTAGTNVTVTNGYTIMTAAGSVLFQSTASTTVWGISSLASATLASGLVARFGVTGLTNGYTVAQNASSDMVYVCNTIGSTGGFGVGATAPGAAIEAEQVITITGTVADGTSGSLLLDPGYTAATAQTVTRHNYIIMEDVSNAGAGPSAVTDSCAIRFNAAAGTHKATVGATTKVTVTAVDAWIKVNINGTIHYVPAYLSTTA